jgi:hypothetical protein
MTDKIVRRIRGEVGSLYIETGDTEWAYRYRAWIADPSKPAPMPRGHLMFKPEHYADYGVEGVTPAERQGTLMGSTQEPHAR